MKRYLLTAMTFVLAAAMAHAQARIGGHVGMAMNGSLELDSPFGSGSVDLEDAGAFGAQLTHRANEAMSLEISATRFSTEIEDVSDSDMDVTTIAATLRLGGSPSEGVYIYVGGGGSYNIFDADGIDAEDEFGFHFCGGLELPINQTMQFFVDYRMTYIAFDTGVDDYDLDYEFGLLRTGLNFSL